MSLYNGGGYFLQTILMDMDFDKVRKNIYNILINT